MNRRTLRGNNALEFALTLPLLLVLGSGIVDFSWYLVQYRASVNAVREGCRIGAASGTDLMAQEAELAAKNSLTELDLEREPDCNEVFLPSGKRAVTCQVAFDFQPLVGFPGASPPEQISYSLTMRAMPL